MDQLQHQVLLIHLFSENDRVDLLYIFINRYANVIENIDGTGRTERTAKS